MGDRVLAAVSACAGLLLGLLSAWLVLRRARQGAIPIDLPDERRLHDTPTPRGGGVGVLFAGALASAAAALTIDGGAERRMVVLVGLVWALPNGIIGWIDDYRPLRSRVKFALQVGAAAVACALGLRLEVLSVPPFEPLPLGPVSWPFTILWLVWAANLYNFMDGMDALAGTAALVFLGGFLVWSLDGGALGLACLAAGLAGAMAGFLRYNLPPARIFMGDAGSLYAGAAIGGLVVALARAEIAGVPFAASTLLLGLFVWDATFTIGWRAVTRQPMLPHRTHLYQRLVLAGWSQARVRTVYLAGTLLLALAALTYPRAGALEQAGILAAALAGCLLLVLVTRFLERRAR